SENPEFARIELLGFACEFTQDFVADGTRRLDLSFAATGRAGFAQNMSQRFTCALACHFHQPQCRKARDRDFGAITCQSALELIEYGSLVILVFHIDEIEDDDAAEITQSQLTCDGV